jgi:hypothetical protein
MSQGFDFNVSLDNDHILFRTLKAHFRAGDQRLGHMMVGSITGSPSIWTKDIENGAGDLNSPVEIFITSQDLKPLSGRFGFKCQKVIKTVG